VPDWEPQGIQQFPPAFNRPWAPGTATNSTDSDKSVRSLDFRLLSPTRYRITASARIDDTAAGAALLAKEEAQSSGSAASSAEEPQPVSTRLNRSWLCSVFGPLDNDVGPVEAGIFTMPLKAQMVARREWKGERWDAQV
jgi:hypothetical protein